MGRLRNIKPQFFQHEHLFEAEKSCGLPLRLAFIGLWTQCDKEGRFEWRPLRLKANIMPWDEVDFAAILDALADGGFIVRYAVGDKTVGAIPSWRKHQRPHPNESPSPWPPPPDTTNHATTSPNGESPSTNGASEEHLGRKGFAKDSLIDDSLIDDSLIDDSLRTDIRVSDPEAYSPEFESFWNAYPRKIEKRKTFRAWRARRKEGVSADNLLRAAEHYAIACAAKKTETRFIKHGSTFLGPDRSYEDWLNPHSGERDESRPHKRNPGQRYDPSFDPHA